MVWLFCFVLLYMCFFFFWNFIFFVRKYCVCVFFCFLSLYWSTSIAVNDISIHLFKLCVVVSFSSLLFALPIYKTYVSIDYYHFWPYDCVRVYMLRCASVSVCVFFSTSSSKTKKKIFLMQNETKLLSIFSFNNLTAVYFIVARYHKWEIRQCWYDIFTFFFIRWWWWRR